MFTLVHQGAIDGNFTDRLLSALGYRMLLGQLLLDVIGLPDWISKRRERAELLIFQSDGEPIGFVRALHCAASPSRQDLIYIDLCAVLPELRGQGHGTTMIRMFVGHLPAGWQVAASCTKYSRAMIHVLRRLHFRRDTAGAVHSPETYRMVTAPPPP
ncbi:MAG: GNAT family N-acetyltransferase [Pseudomonadota bacterium]|nr:GNAT family N-acetyltransferase [Pseudomonadota bacterium]